VQMERKPRAGRRCCVHLFDTISKAPAAWKAEYAMRSRISVSAGRRFGGGLDGLQRKAGEPAPWLPVSVAAAPEQFWFPARPKS
jgi:hypothetical protein